MKTIVFQPPTMNAKKMWNKTIVDIRGKVWAVVRWTVAVVLVLTLIEIVTGHVRWDTVADFWVVARWPVAAILILVFIYTVVVNVWIICYCYRYQKHVSLLPPLLGGSCGALGIALLPCWSPISWWVPLVVDASVWFGPLLVYWTHRLLRRALDGIKG